MGGVERTGTPSGDIAADMPAAGAPELREWLQIPAHLRVPGWAEPRLAETLRAELVARRGLRLDEAVFGIVDLETTGTSTAAHRILEVGLVVQRAGKVLETLDTLVDIGSAVPSGITALTGISDELLVDALDESEVLRQLGDIVQRQGVHALVAHNARFDRGFLERAWRDHGMSPDLPIFLCSVRLARLCVRAPRYGLDTLIRQLSIPLRPRHRAFGDAAMTADLWYELLGRAKLQGIHTLEALMSVAGVGRTKKARRSVRVVSSREDWRPPAEE